LSESRAFSQTQDFVDLTSKLNRLERDIRALSRRVYKGEGGVDVSATELAKSSSNTSVGSAYIIRLEDRLSDLKGELQSTTNSIESLRHDIDGIKGRVDKLVGDIDFRLTRLESVAGRKNQGAVIGQPSVGTVPQAAGVEQVGPSTGGPIISSGKPAILGKIDETNLSMITNKKTNNLGGNLNLSSPKAKPTSLLPKGTPIVQYRHALSILRKTEYDIAELAFKEFIQRYPKNKLSLNARYWLGESFYVRKKFLDAADAFLKAYQQSPKGLKAPDSLLKLGMSLANLKKKQDACDVFSQLAKDYPDASENIKKHLKREFNRAACK